MNKKFYITTPIYYVNDIPHIGHAYTTVAADVIARYHRNLEEDIFFLTGTDEHGAKVAEAAKKAGKEPKEFCNEVSLRFKKTWEKLNISNDYFFRTTDERHGKIVQEILQKIYDRGLIKKGIYEGLYCVGCEKFLTENDLINGCCPLHPNQKPIQQKEENYFFKLSEFKEKLKKAIKDRNDPNHYEILPKSRENEILGKLELGLNDVSISREGVDWGIPLPWDKKQTFYVWIDALLNYYTATRFLENKEKFWPADLHLVGRDILWFHTIIWPALLLAAGLPLPKKIFAHGFFTINGKKISKSLGNVILPDDLIKKFGIDGTRYLILSEFSFGADGDISIKKFETRYNADLANGLGNLVARVAKLCEKAKIEVKNANHSSHFSKEVNKFLTEFKFDQALNFIWSKISEADHYLDQNKPWLLSGKKLNEILDDLIGKIKEIAIHLQPFLPETAKKIQKQFQCPKIKSESPLFPRLV